MVVAEKGQKHSGVGLRANLVRWGRTARRPSEVEGREQTKEEEVMKDDKCWMGR